MGRKSQGLGDFEPNNIRRLREKAGLTLTELARRSGISISYLSNLEQFKRRANLETIKAIGEQLGVSASNLVDVNSVTTSVPVDSIIQADSWRFDVESLPKGEESFDVTIVGAKSYVGVKRHASEVHGTSMNRIYPEGTILVWVLLSEIEEPLIPGRRYVIDRMNNERKKERTVRTYIRDTKGLEWFCFESDDPGYQAPIKYSPEDIHLTIVGRVINSIRSE